MDLTPAVNVELFESFDSCYEHQAMFPLLES